MGMFTRIATDAFDALQTDAGVVLTTFDPYNPWVVPTDDQILVTTTGGINITETMDTIDYAEDVDNAVDNMMEFKRIRSRSASISFSSIKFNAAGAKWALGAADLTTLSNGVKKVAPRKDLQLSDFSDLWWVGDKANGGAYAVHITNALSTGGLSIQTSKGGKGTTGMTITGHVSLQDQTKMPLEIYDIPPAGSTASVTVTYTLTNATSTEDDTNVDIGSTYTTTIAAESGYTLDTVRIIMGGTDITAECYTELSGAVNITAVTAPLEIIATAEET